MSAIVGLQDQASDGWSQSSFGSLEEHRAVLKRFRPDLAWRSRQLSPGCIKGSVIGHRSPRAAVTCTMMSGSFEIRGPVSTDHLVLSLALAFRTAGLRWMRTVQAGTVGIYQPGTDVDAVNRDDVSFAVIDVSRDELDREAALEGLCIPERRLAGSSVVPGAVAPEKIARIARLVALRHRGEPIAVPPGFHLDQMILAAVVHHLALVPTVQHGLPQGAYCRIVARARAYIEAHLDSPIAIDDLVAAAFTSRRTLHRAFAEVLGETPLSYVLKLRLDGIRRDLATPEVAHRTVTTVSHRWGIPELGRLAARYREQFGELPSETVARRNGSRTAWAALPEQAQTA